MLRALQTTLASIHTPCCIRCYHPPQTECVASRFPTPDAWCPRHSVAAVLAQAVSPAHLRPLVPRARGTVPTVCLTQRHPSAFSGRRVPDRSCSLHRHFAKHGLPSGNETIPELLDRAEAVELVDPQAAKCDRLAEIGEGVME